ncbi:MAG: cell cycle transcriptional regulator TrcR [Alphaproteobacteria bacterium]|nr:cell cycle transcriptional regulator TrcR [Alphaproteobacteria bacterium]
MTAPLMPRATAVWLVENTTLTFRQIADFCELHELEIQAIADGDVSGNIMGINPIDNGQLTLDEIQRCEADSKARLEACYIERNVKLKNAKAKKILSPTQRGDKPNAILWIVKNCPELKDTQICKLIGTTKPTIESIREGTHRDMLNLRPKNPVTIGLCSEKDLENAVAIAKAKASKEKK